METIPALDKIEGVLEHIQNVQRNCYKLGLKLIKNGEVKFGRKLIANGQVHDNSKLTGIEFEHLFYNSPLLKDAISHHATTNEHHPECWDGFRICLMYVLLRWFVIVQPDQRNSVLTSGNGFRMLQPLSMASRWMIQLV